ncbi:MAG: S41 family peptidase [Patescibacteria group bacterium]|nr:S41 family peptidase [Patescibacteria group bacterium]
MSKNKRTYSRKMFHSKIFCFLTGGIVLVALLSGAFILGINFGNGNISLSNNTNLNQLPTSLNYSSVNTVYTILKNNFDGKLTANQIMNGIKQGLVNSANDPYTEYFSPSQAKVFNSELNNSFTGIGVELSQNSNKQIIIISPLKGSPAQTAGLLPGDIISSINNISTTSMSIDTAVNDIRGPAGTSVKLGIIRGSSNLVVKITRATINIPTVNYKIIDNNIGYVQITSFSNDTYGLVEDAASTFLKGKVKGIILDLRDDPGGYLSAAINVSSLWLNRGQTILTEKRGDQVVDSFSSPTTGVLSHIPTVVLINSGTASSAEITTAALHDNGHAYIIGTKSFGKGVVQQLFNLPGGAELKVTVASWYRPDNKNINKIGIYPDQVVNMNDKYINTPNDSQLSAAINYFNKH